MALRLANCAPFCQLATLNDTNRFSFYPGAIRTWNSLPLALIPNSLDEFKAIISSACRIIVFSFFIAIILLFL